MSDQDFFFDEEPEKQAGRTPASKPASKTAPKSPSKAAAKPAARTAGSKPASKPAVPASTGDAPFLERSTTMTIAILIGVIGLLIGLIGGYLLAGSQTPTVEAPATGALGAVSGQTPATSTAPVLTEEQINQGQLPAGHPTVGASGTTSP